MNVNENAVLEPPRTPSQISFIAFAALMGAGAMILGNELMQGWFPHDEGALGQSAERVLRGEVPHRDFDEIYTGPLSYWHALSFGLFGVNAIAIRIALFGVSMLWLAGLYQLLRRIAPQEGAALVALTAFIWSVPNYPTGVPSWYLLFAATLAAWAIVRWTEDGRRRWLVLAGAAGGAAFLLKLSGILVVIGGGLAIVTAILSAPQPKATDSDRARFSIPTWIFATMVLVKTVALAWVVSRDSPSTFVRHGLPLIAIVVGILVQLRRSAAHWPRLDVRAADPLLLFGIGAMIPLALLFGFYAIVGGISEMVHGVFVAPFLRVASASKAPPALVEIIWCVPLALLLGVRTAGVGRAKIVAVIAALCFFAVVAWSVRSVPVYRAGWFAAWGLTFLVAIEAARQMFLLARHGPEANAGARRAAVAIACVAVVLTLLEYPFAAPIYTLYALPLTMVALAALIRSSGRVAVELQMVTLLFFLAFGALRILPGNVGFLGLGPVVSRESSVLPLARSGIRMSAPDSARYSALVAVVQQAAAGRPIWAGPDAPEVYFLSELPNRTRTMFDFLDGAAATATPLPARLETLGIAVVVIKLKPDFSRPLSSTVIAELRQAYPESRNVDGFLVLWR